MSFFGKLRKILGKIADVIGLGRDLGLYKEKPGVVGKPHDPTFPKVR